MAMRIATPRSAEMPTGIATTSTSQNSMKALRVTSASRLWFERLIRMKTLFKVAIKPCSKEYTQISATYSTKWHSRNKSTWLKICATIIGAYMEGGNDIH